MKRYEVMISNGPYPLSHMCDSISEAYGCLVELKSWVPWMRDIDLDEVMVLLVDMRNGATLVQFDAHWSIAVHEDET